MHGPNTETEALTALAEAPNVLPALRVLFEQRVILTETGGEPLARSVHSKPLAR